jgi:glyoxylase-like metal-dependent hydrolase (beta-lactamase superfamily II)
MEENSMETKFFTTRRIADRTIKIRGLGFENAYLLEGDTQALLIDTLAGAGNLRAYCRELTDLNLQIILTHGHPDHSGGSFDFGACFVHPEDIRILYDSASVQMRREFIEHFNRHASFLQWSDFTPPCALRTYPVYDGDSFDLGGRLIEVIGVPGHTHGSVVLLDREQRILFSGDACDTNTLLYLDGSTSIAEYKQSLLRLKERQGEFDHLWGGHGGKPLPPLVIDEALMLCDKIFDGSDAAEETGVSNETPYYYARNRKGDDGLIANIAYRRDWLYQAPHNRTKPIPADYE